MSSAGGFAFLAGGYKRPDALAAEIAAARQWMHRSGSTCSRCSHRVHARPRTGRAHPTRRTYAVYSLRPPATVGTTDLWPKPSATHVYLRARPQRSSYRLQHCPRTPSARSAGRPIRRTIRPRPAQASCAEIIGVDPHLTVRWSARQQVIKNRSAELSVQFQRDHGRPPMPVEALRPAQQATLETRERQLCTVAGVAS